jgi:hypothetical protein
MIEATNHAIGIFGVPLHESIKYASVAISLYNDQGQPFVYGYIPIVVAKCGLFLKECATEVEGIFRLSGSAKRIKELQEVFNMPPKYGKQHDWDAYTVHDAANVLRRYLNHLPDPIIPTDWYDSVREPIREGWPIERAIPRMQELVSSLPPVNRQLLLYILDLLAVFASKAEQNRMTSENLSAIFQPGVLSHPRDDMAPQEYHLSQKVLVFLIDNQAHFLLDMCAPTGPAEMQQPVKQLDAAAPQKRTLLRRQSLNTPRRSLSFRSPKTDPPTSPPSSAATTQSTAPSGKHLGSVSRSNTMPTKRQAPGVQPRLEPRHVSLPTGNRIDKTVSPPLRNQAHAATSTTAAPGTVAATIMEDPEAPATLPVLVPVPTFTASRSPASSRTSLRLEDSVRHVPSVSQQQPGEGRRSRRSSQGSSLRGDGEFSILSGRKLKNMSTESISASGELSSSLPGQGTESLSDGRPVPMSASIGRSSQTSTDVPLTSSSGHGASKASSSPGKFSNFFKRRTRLGKDEMLSPNPDTPPQQASSRRALDS